MQFSLDTSICLYYYTPQVITTKVYSMKSSETFKRMLKSQAHHLKPVVIIGNKGLTEAVQLEIERALFDHELIKVRVNAEDKAARKDIIEKICQARNASLIQTIGHIAVLYRENEEKK